MRYMGPPGTANLAKLLGNLLQGIETELLAEIVSLAEAGGISATRTLDFLETDYAGSIHERWESLVHPAEVGEANFGLSPNLTVQVLPRVWQTAHSWGVVVPLIEQLHGIGTGDVNDRATANLPSRRRLVRDWTMSDEDYDMLMDMGMLDRRRDLSDEEFEEIRAEWRRRYGPQ